MTIRKRQENMLVLRSPREALAEEIQEKKRCGTSKNVHLETTRKRVWFVQRLCECCIKLLQSGKSNAIGFVYWKCEDALLCEKMYKGFNLVITNQTSSLKSDRQSILIYRILPDDLMLWRASNKMIDPWNRWYSIADERLMTQKLPWSKFYISIEYHFFI